MTRKPFLTRASSYDELHDQLDYRTIELPEFFNLGVACVDDNDPDSRALTTIAPDRSSQDYTFGEIKRLTNQLGNALRRRGIGPQDIVAVINPQSMETAVSLMGIWRMGAIALPISQLFGPDALQYRFEDSGAKAVIVTAQNEAAVREALGTGSDVPVIVIGAGSERDDDFANVLAAESNEMEPVNTRAQDPCLLIYTSGTTGNPKGALHAHRMAFGQVPAVEALFDFMPQPNDVLWSVADWAWIAGIGVILEPGWFHGVPVVVDLAQGFDPERALWLMREHKVTLSLLPATALRGIRTSGLPGGDFDLRVMASGGEPLGAELSEWTQEFFGCDVNDAYGQTELNGVCIHSGRVYPTRPGSVGRATPGSTVAVIDADGNPVIDQTGEVAIDRRHPLAMIEYWKNPEATAEKFHENWLLTGDLGRMDTDGYVWFESRKDDVFKTSGYRVGPTEIENTLGSHDAVALSAVIGVPDEKRGHVPKAFVVLRDPSAAGDEIADELRAFVRTRLAPHEVPREIVFVDDLPRTVTGKILRRALRDD